MDISKLKLKESCFWDHAGEQLQLRLNKESQHFLSIPNSKLPWLKIIQNESSLGEVLDQIVQLENKLPLAEFLSFLSLLSQSGYLESENIPSFENSQSDATSNEDFLDGKNDVDIVNELEKVSFFDSFPRSVLETIVSKSLLQKLAPGTYVVKQGERAQEFFVLLRGSVSVYVKKASGNRERVCILRERSVFGESAFRENAFRGADVFAKTETQLLLIPPQFFLELTQKTLQSNKLYDLEDRIYLSQYLSTSPLFQKLPTEALSLFVKAGERLEVKKNQTLFKQGDKGDAFYLIVRGKMSVAHGTKAPALLKQGDCLGEIALLKGIPRTATVMAFEDSVLLKISTEDFWSILFQNISMALMLEDVAESRYKGEVLTLT